MAASLRLLHLLSAPAHDEAQARFDALHRRSVLLNGTVLLLGVAAFALAVVERSPL